MLKRFVWALVLALGVSNVALGDDASPKSPEAPSAANIDSTTLAAAKDLLDANGTSNNLAAIIQNIVPALLAQEMGQNQKLSAEENAAYRAAVQEEMLASRDRLIDMYAVLYAEHFTADELHQLAAFYRSDIGKKYISTIPVMLKETPPLAIEYAKEILPRVRDRANSKLQKESKPQ